MNDVYDMNVNYDVLCEIQKRLQSIMLNLTESSDCMVEALSRADNYLEGSQYSHACEETIRCAGLAQKTAENLQLELAYLERIKTTLEKYNRYKYYG